MTILVIGDVMVDDYVTVRVERMSQEAPIPILDRQRHEYSLGGAANVAKNLQLLGRKVILLGVVGNDVPGHWLRRQFDVPEHLLVYRQRSTTVKTRFVDQHGTQVARVDAEDREDVVFSPAEMDHLEKLITSNLHPSGPIEAIVLSDYGKGVITSRLAESVIGWANGTNYSRVPRIPVYVDPKGSDWRKYRVATVITPNHLELQRSDYKDGRKAAEKVMSTVVETRGELGAVCYFQDGFVAHATTEAVQVASTIGAGDVFMAAMVDALVGFATPPSKQTLMEAVRRGCLAASRAVTRRGTCVIQ